jgi:plasmid stabilization system protein ParE
MSMFDPVPYETSREARDLMAVASGRMAPDGSQLLRDLSPAVAGAAAALEAGGDEIGRPRRTTAREWLDDARGFEGAMLGRAVGRLLNQIHAQGSELDMSPGAVMSELVADVSLQSAAGREILRGGVALSPRQEEDRDHVARGRFERVSEEGRIGVSEAMRDARHVPASVSAEIERIGRGGDVWSDRASPQMVRSTESAMHAANGLGSVSEDGLDGFSRAIAAAALVLEAHPPAALAPYGVKAESYLEPYGSLGGATLRSAAARELSPEGEDVLGKAPRDVVADMVARVHAKEDGLDEAAVRSSLPKDVIASIDEMSKATAIDRSAMGERSSYVNDRLGSFSDGHRRLFRGFTGGTEGPQAEAEERLEELSGGRLRPTDAIEHGVLAHIKAFPDEIAGHRAAARMWMLADALVDHEAPSAAVSSPAAIAARTEALAGALYDRRRQSDDLSLARTRSLSPDEQRELFQEVHAGERVSPVSRGRIAMTAQAIEAAGAERSERMSRYADPAWLAATAAFAGTQRN